MAPSLLRRLWSVAAKLLATKLASLSFEPQIEVANIEALDAWIAKQPEPRPSRPEAIRFALRDWLEARKSRGRR